MRSFHPILFATALVAAASAGPACSGGPGRSAHATEPLPPLAGQIIRSICRQGECGWTRVVRLESAGRFSRGELRRLTARQGSSLHLDAVFPDTAAEAEIEWEAADHTDYIFCSREQPAYAFDSEFGGWFIHFLDLFALAGYQLDSGMLYMRVCHGSDGLPDDDVLTSLGYHSGTRSYQHEAPDLNAAVALLTS